MTPSFFEAAGESAQEPASRRGRRSQPVGDEAGIAHRGWLEPCRRCLNASGLTLSHLSERVTYSKPHLSKLLRGKGGYPRWETASRIGAALGMPLVPMQRLWVSGALERGQKQAWIDRCVDEVPPSQAVLPLPLRALADQMRAPYTDFAGVFLLNSHQAGQIVAEAFDILWMCWELATASSNANRYAWSVLRARVLPRAPMHPDGTPDLAMAALFTQSYADAEVLGADARAAQLRESIALFDAISRLPHNPLDAIVLRHLCGRPETEIPHVLGVTPALARVYDDHGRQILDADLTPGGTVQ
jgi:transcriptional regulator with XRE-family HTH domain